MTEQTEISTERLLLKSITPALIHTIYSTRTKEDILKFFGFDEAGYQHFKAMHEKGMETHRLSFHSFLLIEKQTGLPIGECGFHTWNTVHHRAELYYVLRNDAHKQKGFMTEALDLILDFGFSRLNLHRVEALTASWNTASLKLLANFGFTREGTMREDYLVNGRHEDSECFSLLKPEWEKKRPGEN